MATTRHSRRSREGRPPEMSIGRYTRLDEIGRGSFATVYQGVHTKTRTYVAIKSVNVSKLNKKLKDNLSTEIEILKQLHHPHIVALIDCQPSASHIHLVMEYCALGDLSMFIRRRETLGDHRYTRDMIIKYPNPRNGALNEVLVRHFLKQLASALKFLRDRNLVHRDIKPQNLLLCPSPALYRSGMLPVIPYKGSESSFEPMTGLESLPMLKLADFGFARSLPSTSLAETLCGSPLYMAPEILRYEKYDATADLWSVGTVLYEMVVGRPPFRATNHVELLRKIELSGDRIKIPEDNPASAELKALIRALLKRNPVERLNFAQFFENELITGEIPGLVGDDRPPERRTPPVGDTAPPPSPRSESRQPSGLPTARVSRESPYSEPSDEVITYPKPQTSRVRPETPPTSTSMRRTGSSDRPPSASKESARMATAPPRPAASSHATTPVLDRRAAATIMERQRSRNTYSAGSPLAVQLDDKAREERERAAQDVAFERDYVVVEKRAVEVNAFADELAHSPRFQGGGFSRPNSGGGIMPRRATTQAVPTTATSPSNTASKAVQVVPGRARADSGHYRQSSYERRYGQSPTSATSAISKALNMASGRLFGVGFSPPLSLGKGGRSPPMLYNPFPTYPSSQGNLMITGDGGKTHAAVDEDTKTMQTIEECATRSDVVYGFAEVKYKQLIPLTPAVNMQTNMNMPMRPSVPSANSEDDDPGGRDRDRGRDSMDDGLTVDATVILSEEALVLYVKALSLLAKSMDIAGAWWARKNRGDPYGGGIDATYSRVNTDAGGGTNALVGMRINHIVQWVRNRFNEVLEKAEFVRRKLIDAQKRLPTDHPSHPSNHPAVMPATSGSSSTTDVVVSSGITAEKLMYDRALEMSRAAAINELTGEDLPGCEIAYVTAIRMLEAVLEEDEMPSSSTTATQGSAERAAAGGGGSGSSRTRDNDRLLVIDGVQMEDRQVVIKLVSSIRGRLASLRKKLALVQNQRLSSASSSPVGSMGRVPSSYPGGVVPFAQAQTVGGGGTPPK